MKVMWKKGAQVSCKPEVAYRELERIRKDNDGNLELAEIVRQSKPKDAPLHNEFEWNNARAADKYRLQQARYIARSIEVVRPEAPTVQSRAYEVVEVTQKAEEKSKKVYKPVEDILSDPIARDDLIAQAIKDAHAYKRRYHALSELSKVFHAMDEFMDRVAV